MNKTKVLLEGMGINPMEKIDNNVDSYWTLHVLIDHCNEQLILNGVGVSLPSLVIEEHHKKYMAYLKGVKGIVAQGDTKEDSVNELMLLIKIKLLYDLGN